MFIDTLVCFLIRHSKDFNKIYCHKQGRFFVTNLCKSSILTFGTRNFYTLRTLPKTNFTASYRFYIHTRLNYGGISKLLPSPNLRKIWANKWLLYSFKNNEEFSKGLNCWGQSSRNISNSMNRHQQRNRTTAVYTVALVIVVLGASYAAVPLYRIFCQASGLGGTVQQANAGEKIKNMTTRKERLLTVRFNADKSATMQWSFKPQQPEVKVYPGETALAFYTAKNPTDMPVTGISTYNVIPFEAGQYFNKIQCFCFEEQRLNPHEQVDMPVFFYVDPEFLDDPALFKVDTITLSYTFFQAKEGLDLGIK